MDNQSVADFLENLQNLLERAEQHRYTQNVNIIEFLVRRLEDALHVLMVVYMNTSDEDLSQNISKLVEYTETYRSIFEELSSDNCSSNVEIPRLIYGQNGRPQMHLPQETLDSLYAEHQSWTKVARMLGKYISFFKKIF